MCAALCASLVARTIECSSMTNAYTFKRCNSPACLGMVEYNCCGTVDQDGRASDAKDFVIDSEKNSL